MNIAIIAGNLGKDPDLRALPNGTAKLTFSVATRRKYKSAAGAWQEETTWHNVVVWGKHGEGLATFLRKGNHVVVHGRIDTRSYESKGERKWITEIVAEDVQVPRAPQQSEMPIEGQQRDRPQNRRRPQGQPRQVAPADFSPPPPPDDYDDGGASTDDQQDIPF